MTIRIGIDTGGTFTDLVAVDETTHRTSIVKRPSTPSHPSQAVFDALENLKIPLEDVSALILGTTLATNALLTRQGARVLYVTTSGRLGSGAGVGSGAAVTEASAKTVCTAID